ncbi:MAG: DNRLRE domain-containing protein [Thermoleophilaceae bacterium]
MEHSRTLLRPVVVLAVAAAAAALALTALLSSDANGSGAPAGRRADARVVREMPRLRTRYSDTYATTAGTYVTRSYGYPVNYRAGRRWKPIDNSLVTSPAAGYAYANAASSYSLSLPDALDGKPVRVSAGGHSVSFALHGAKHARPSAKAGVANYASALPGVNARYEAKADQVKEGLVLDGPTATRSFTFDVRVSHGLRARKSDAGGVDFVDSKGTPQLAFAPPSMTDAAGAKSNAVSMKLRRAGSGYRVKLSASRSWLDARDRRYPVTVDPTTTSVNPTEDCYIVGGTQASSHFCGFAANELNVGTDSSGNPNRAYMRFDTSGVPADAEVLEGDLHLHVDSGSQRQVDVYHLTHDSTSQRTWNTYDGTNSWGTAGGDISGSDGSNSAVGGTAGWYEIGARKLVQGWVDKSTNNYGLLLKDTGTPATLMQISASEQTSLKPFLEVEWSYRTGIQGRWTFEDQRLSDRMLLKTNVGNGNLILQESDIHIPGIAGENLNFKRFWNNREAFTDSNDDLGHYWRMGTGYDVWLKPDSAGDVQNFNGPSDFWAPYDKQSDGSYTTPTGMNADLKKNADGTFTLTYRGSQKKLDFSSIGEFSDEKDRNGNKISFAYSGSGARLTSIKDAHDQGTSNNTLTLTYNGSGWLDTVTDRATPQRSWHYGYTGSLLTSYTNPDGKVTHYAYDANENLTDITDPRGNVTHMTYDSQYRVTSIRRWTDTAHTVGPLTQYSYTSTLDSDCSGESSAKTETIETDPNGHTIKYCVDKLQRITKTVDGRGKTRKKTYTGNSDVNQVTTAGGQAWQLGFDSNDRATGSTAPGSGGLSGIQTKIGYDSTITDKSNPNFWLGNSSTDSQGNSYSYQHDSNGNLTKVTDGLSSNNSITISPNSDGTPHTITDPAGGITTYGYTNGDLTSIDRPGTALGSESFTYDAAHPHMIKTRTDGRGKVATYTYDLLGRVQQVSFSDGTWVAYAYDENGNITARIDALGQTTYQYDALNRVTSETFPSGSTDTYTYDAAGNLKTITDAGGTTTYNYGASNLLDSMQAPGDSSTTTYTYNDDNQRKTTTYPNGVVMTSTWEDGAGGNSGPNRLKEIKAVKGATTITDFTYAYNKGTSDTGLRQSVTDKNGTTSTFLYDPLNRLKSATNYSGHDYSYTYDGRGNIDTRVIDGATTSYGYNLANEVCWAVSGTQPDNDCTPAPTGATTYSYDAAGNLTSGGTFTGTYNDKEQATAMSGLGGEASISLSHYNANEFERATAGSKSFVNNALGVGSETSAGSTTYYRRDAGGGMQSERLASGAAYYYVFDGLGSVRAVTDSSGTAQNTYSYDPYGAIVSQTTPVANPWQFASGYHDANGWYKFGARYYTGRLQRWSQLDPEDQPTDPVQQDRFAYAGDDPINATDPQGTCVAGINIGSQCQPAGDYDPDLAPGAGTFSGVICQGRSALDQAECTDAVQGGIETYDHYIGTPYEDWEAVQRAVEITENPALVGAAEADEP